MPSDLRFEHHDDRRVPQRWTCRRCNKTLTTTAPTVREELEAHARETFHYEFDLVERTLRRVEPRSTTTDADVEVIA